MLAESPYAVLITGTVLIGLWLSNSVYDHKIPHYISRKIGHAAGGLGFLIMALVFSSAFWPLVLTVSFGLLLWLARLLRPVTFRGVGGSGRSPKIMAEVWFAWVAVPVLAISWLWLDQPLTATACLLFMAWGDCVTGLIRSQIYHEAVKGLWGSLAMLLVCLAISWALIKPFWIGAAGAVTATLVEWAFGDVGQFKWGDDNWAIPVFSLAVVLGLAAITGNFS